MITVSIFLIFTGCFFLYNTSKKASLNYGFVPSWSQSNASISNFLGVTLNTLGLIATITSFGIITGVLFWMFSLILILGCIVILAPLKKGLYKPVSLILLVLLLLETFN